MHHLMICSLACHMERMLALSVLFSLLHASSFCLLYMASKGKDWKIHYNTMIHINMKIVKMTVLDCWCNDPDKFGLTSSTESVVM